MMMCPLRQMCLYAGPVCETLLYMKLLPSLNDGRHYSVSFRMLLDMFLEFSG